MGKASTHPPRPLLGLRLHGAGPGGSEALRHGGGWGLAHRLGAGGAQRIQRLGIRATDLDVVVRIPV